MTILEAIEARHSVRRYTTRHIAPDVVAALNRVIDSCNSEGNLRIQLVLEDERTFGSVLTHYGAFSGVRNYFAIIGSGDNLSERAGYYGERLVLEAQRLGLNTCWVALTYSKRFCHYRINVLPGQKLVCVIAVGYGVDAGHSHKIKSYEKVTRGAADAPDWFRRGVQSALLAPTAINQQKFVFHYTAPRQVRATAKLGPYSKIDLGIAKLHFELAAGTENFDWA